MKHGGKSRPTPGLPFLLSEEEEDTDPETGELEGAQVGEYRLVARLATGGMAEVWLADALGGPLAGGPAVVKRLLPQLRKAADCVARFRAEADLGTRLTHPNLARAFGLIEARGELFLAQELVGGETLSLLAAAARPDGSVKLIDLGLAQELPPGGSVPSPDGALRGTPSYMSPEQVKARPLDARSDLFSAGAALWELLANRPLFAAATEFETLRRVREMPAPPLRAVWREAPTVLERLCVRALAKDEEQRFASAAELLEALEQAA